jgi:UDP-glucose 4-epimerase
MAISIFTERALKGQNIEIFGAGDKTRDFTYVDDVVEANLLAMKQGDGEVYNIGSGARISINELAKKVVLAVGSNSEVVYMPPKIGDAEHTWANVDKAKRCLGYAPRVDINLGLQFYIAWRRTFNKTCS